MVYVEGVFYLGGGSSIWITKNDKNISSCLRAGVFLMIYGDLYV